jgi:DNA (cytosine-5)-methyltransferase 1
METTKKLKVLNLYAGIGGNRKLWTNVDVTAVENNPEIAKVYQDFFPEDKVIVGDAHKYLIEHFQEFDFIWSSPPCPSHSKFRFMTTKMNHSTQSRPIIYPNMELYQEIILLKHYCKGLFVVENVQSYYEPLINPQKIGRHFIWANFEITPIKVKSENAIKKHSTALSIEKNFDIKKYKLQHRKDTILRNCVLPEVGLHIFNNAFKKVQTKLEVKQEAMQSEARHSSQA